MALASPISEPAGQELAANWTRVQTLSRWALSTCSPFGSVTTALLRVRFAFLRLQHRVNRRVPATVDAAVQLEGQLGLVGQAGAVGDLEAGPQAERSPFVCRAGWRHRSRIAIGGVEREVRPVEVDPDRAQPQRNTAEDLRQRIGRDRHLGRDRVDVDRCADHHVAEVVGPGNGGRHEDHAQRSPLVGAGEEGTAR